MVRWVKNGNESEKFRTDLSQQQYLKSVSIGWVVGWKSPGRDISWCGHSCCLRLQVMGSSHHREESDNKQTGCQDFSQAIWISVASSTSRCKFTMLSENQGWRLVLGQALAGQEKELERLQGILQDKILGSSRSTRSLWQGDDGSSLNY